MLTNRPKTKLLVDGGDPEETLRIKNLIGFVDGQTTNPSLIAKNPEIQRRLASGHQLSEQEEKDAYKKIVQSIKASRHLWEMMGCPLRYSQISIAVPSKGLQEWTAVGFPMPDQDFKYKAVDAKGKRLKPIAYKEPKNWTWTFHGIALILHTTYNQEHSEICG